VKVALDTYVLVSAVATRGLCADILQATLAEHQLVVGETVLAELRRVLRQKLRVPPDTVDETDAFLRRQAVVVEAVAGGANVLVTGDQDLLEAANKAPLPILTPRGFWERLRTNHHADE
jgi:predicted nucleic acid-binding protein